MEPVILDHLPEGLLDKPATELHTMLDGPTLVHLPGRNPRPLFVAVLQHGNEDTGWEAIRRLLRSRYSRDPLPRSLALLIGNVEAAHFRRRHLDHQPDFNRCWPTGKAGEPESPWHAMFAVLTEHMRHLDPVASVDVHNNSGRNPLYAAVNRIENRTLQLACRFSRTVLHFTEPAGVQSLCFSSFCPSVTLECGQAGREDGTDHTLAYLDQCLHLEELPDRMPPPDALQLCRMTATVTVPKATSFGFHPDTRGMRLVADLDNMNFREMPPGTRLAHVGDNKARGLQVTHHDGRDISEDCFEVRDGTLVTRRPLIPAMLSIDETIIRQDCLCYLMERVDPFAGHPLPGQALDPADDP